MSIDRRKFLVQAGAGVSLLALSKLFPGLSFLPQAQAGIQSLADDHFFVIIEAGGGWDVTLGLDPMIMPADATAEDVFIEYKPEDILEKAAMRVGPAARSIVPYLGDSAIVNGIVMRKDTGHPALRVYMTSGKSDGSAASIPIELGAVMGTGPMGLLYNSNNTMSEGPRAITESSVQDLLKRAQAATQSGGDWTQDIGGDSTGDPTPLELALRSLVNGRRVGEEVFKRLKALSDSGVKPEARHALAAAFAAGGARQGRLEIDYGLDTHVGHVGMHLKNQAKLWDDVAAIFKVFQETQYRESSLFDYTTFMVVSEFSRTPALNAAGGKDHNPLTNSCLLAGKGVRGGITIGESRLMTRNATGAKLATHMGAPFDYASQTIATSRDGASFIFPENIIRTVDEIFGQPEGFASVDLSTHWLRDIVRA